MKDDARPQCVAHAAKRDGEQCRNKAIAGATVCRFHGGNAPQVRARAAVRAELASWGLTDVTLDPGETLLRLMTQAVLRADWYASMLQAAFDAYQSEDPAYPGVPAGVRALIGRKYASDGDGGRVEVGEEIRGLAHLEAAERDRAASFAEKAVRAGLAERQVRIVEKQASMLAAVIRGILGDLNLSEDQEALINVVVPRHLRAISE